MRYKVIAERVFINQQEYLCGAYLVADDQDRYTIALVDNGLIERADFDPAQTTLDQGEQR